MWSELDCTQSLSYLLVMEGLERERPCSLQSRARSRISLALVSQLLKEKRGTSCRPGQNWLLRQLSFSCAGRFRWIVKRERLRHPPADDDKYEPAVSQHLRRIYPQLLAGRCSCCSLMRETSWFADIKELADYQRQTEINVCNESRVHRGRSTNNGDALVIIC